MRWFIGIKLVKAFLDGFDILFLIESGVVRLWGLVDPYSKSVFDRAKVIEFKFFS